MSGQFCFCLTICVVADSPWNPKSPFLAPMPDKAKRFNRWAVAQHKVNQGMIQAVAHHLFSQSTRSSAAMIAFSQLDIGRPIIASRHRTK